jgi:hypothetical protein
VRRAKARLCRCVRNALQKSGLIQYSRGTIDILNREAIEECACECYAAIRHQIDDMFPLKQ